MAIKLQATRDWDGSRMILLVEVQGTSVTRHEWFLDAARLSSEMTDRVEEWRDEREVPKGETVSSEGHRWFIIDVLDQDSTGGIPSTSSREGECREATPYATEKAPF
jgi:hypothetical protein